MSASSSRIGISRVLFVIRATIAASSSSRSQGLAAETGDTTTTAATVLSPSSRSFWIRLSPGLISHLSSQDVTPRLASARPSGSVKSALSSLACERKALGGTGAPSVSR